MILEHFLSIICSDKGFVLTNSLTLFNIINSVDKTNYLAILSHHPRTTVSLETLPLKNIGLLKKQTKQTNKQNKQTNKTNKQTNKPKRESYNRKGTGIAEDGQD